MQLDIITPEKTAFKGEVTLVTVPGTKGPFTILKDHAPIISSLAPGTITYRVGEEEFSIESAGGFIEVNNNVISIAIELPNNE